MPDSVKIYDRITLEYAGGFPVAGGVGAICRDAKDGLWMMQERRIVCFSVATGQLKPQSVSLPEHVVTSNFSIDLEKGRMLVPNSGRDLNILIYGEIYTSPVLSGTFGERGGILSRTEKHLPGETAPLHFGGPRAVARIVVEIFSWQILLSRAVGALHWKLIARKKESCCGNWRA